MMTPSSAFTVFVLAVSAVPFAWADDNPCPTDCVRMPHVCVSPTHHLLRSQNTFKINEPPEPETGYDGLKAFESIMDGMFNFMRARIFDPTSMGWNSFGYIGGGLFTGIFGAATAQDKSEWERYQQQKDLKQQQDYFACVMESQISKLAYEGKQYMDDARVNSFNNAISGVVTYITNNCAAHNCLNVTDIEPSRRNNATGVQGATCVIPYTPTDNTCKGIKWDPANQKRCSGLDASGNIMGGICGEDGQCWHSDVTFKDTIDKYQQLKMAFLTKDSIDQFNAFNDLWNPTAVVAYAKGATVYLSLLQELYMLGSASAEEGAMRAHANQTANWLQSRIDYHTNRNVSLVTVNAASSFKEPVTLRYSCRPSDLYDNNAWLGCAQYVPGWNPNMDVCLFPPNTTGNAYSKLCACDCSTDDKKKACYWGPTTTDKTFGFEVANFNKSMYAAADALSARNDMLFNTTGVYNITQLLRSMVALDPIMPINTKKYYQDVMTPRQMCNGGLGSRNGEMFLQRHGIRPLGLRHNAKEQEGATVAQPPKAADTVQQPQPKQMPRKVAGLAQPPKAADAVQQPQPKQMPRKAADDVQQPQPRQMPPKATALPQAP